MVVGQGNALVALTTGKKTGTLCVGSCVGPRTVLDG